jgi:hypothetical protein
VPPKVRKLMTTAASETKLAARGISDREAKQVPYNWHVVRRNPRDTAGTRPRLIGLTDGGRVLTLVIERTFDPTTWLVVTGWTATAAERKLLGRRL